MPADFNSAVKLIGLDLDRRYAIEELGLTASGRTLANAGVLLPRLPDYGSWTWHIYEIDK